MITIKTKIGNTVVEVSNEKVTDAIQMAAFFGELPQVCPRCNEPVHLTYREAQDYKFYGMACAGGHQTTFGQLKKGGFYLKKDKWLTYEESKTATSNPDHQDPTPDGGSGDGLPW